MLFRSEKTLADFQTQANKPFEQEQKLRELLARQAQVNAALDLDKNEHQVAPDDPGDSPEVDQPQTFPARVEDQRHDAARGI